MVSLLGVFDVDFPGGTFNDNIKWRAFIWAVSEGFLVLSIAINYLPPKLYSAVFKFSIFIIMLDFFLCLIWLPIGVSKTYGFRTASEAFTSTCLSFDGLSLSTTTDYDTNFSVNGTGAPAGWNWMLSL